MSVEDKIVTMTSRFRVFVDNENSLVLLNLVTGEAQSLDPDVCFLEFEANYRIGAQTRRWNKSNMREVWN